MIAGRNVLVTGGAGSVGRALVHRLLDRDPQVIRIFDNSEPGLARMRAALDDDRCRYLAGDVRDRERLDRAVNGIDTVIHLAAMKHVDICEYNPFEAVKTNVLGVQNLIEAAIDGGVDHVLFTSSDKAVNPANTMGTTKLLGEKLVTAGNKYSGGYDIKLASVRFGNVINSSESVVPRFREQITRGGPVKLTDPRMTRFFLTYDDVAELITDALEHSVAGELFVYKMAAVRIEDLATAMIESLAPDFGHDPDKIEVEVTGRRLGETFHEEILTDREVGRTVENDLLYAVIPEQSRSDGYMSHDGLPGFESAEKVVRSSEDAETLSESEIVELLETGAYEEAPA